MSRPLDFLQNAISASDNTRVHSNIDNLLFKSEMDNQLRQYSMSQYKSPQPITGTVPDVALNPLFALRGLLKKIKFKKPNEEMLTLYRGVDKWYPNQMVQSGKFVGSGKRSLMSDSKKYFFTTKSKDEAKSYAGGKGFWADPQMTEWVEKKPSGVVLEFQVPKRIIDKIGRDAYGQILNPKTSLDNVITFEDGLSKEFLKKIYKYK